MLTARDHRAEDRHQGRRSGTEWARSLSDRPQHPLHPEQNMLIVGRVHARHCSTTDSLTDCLRGRRSGRHECALRVTRKCARSMPRPRVCLLICQSGPMVLFGSKSHSSLPMPRGHRAEDRLRGRCSSADWAHFPTTAPPHMHPMNETPGSGPRRWEWVTQGHRGGPDW